jgi:hypothetical protein
LNSFFVIGSAVVGNSIRVELGLQCSLDVVKTSILDPPVGVQVIVVSDSPHGAALFASYKPPNIGDAFRAS